MKFDQFLLFTLLSLVPLFIFANSEENTITCDAPKFIEAQYKVKTKNPSGGSTKTISLYRSAKQSAFYYQEHNVVELWEATANNRLHLMRYFPSHKRGIEYQPSEIDGPQDWSEKRHIVPEHLLEKMEKKRSKGNGCDQYSKMKFKDKSIKTKLTWLDAYQIPKKFYIKNKTHSVEWELLNINLDETRIKQQFTTWGTYQTTDYTDIGDNESDPFLLNMINLGFIEHGHSGFYDSEGNTNEHRNHHQ